jgi:hypothetical protein
MEIGLPPLFAHRLNLLDQALIEYQSAYKEDPKQEAMAKIFVISCEMMNSLDIPKLGEDMKEVVRRREESSTTPAAAGRRVIPSTEMFDDFLDLENSIFAKIGIDSSTRSRISEYIANLKAIREQENLKAIREKVGYIITSFAWDPLNADEMSKINVDEISKNIEELKVEICNLARTTLSKLRFKEATSKMEEERQSWRAKVVNISCSVFGVGVTMINTTAGLAAFMTADTATYSIGAGTTLIALRK